MRPVASRRRAAAAPPRSVPATLAPPSRSLPSRFSVQRSRAVFRRARGRHVATDEQDNPQPLSLPWTKRCDGLRIRRRARNDPRVAERRDGEPASASRSRTDRSVASSSQARPPECRPPLDQADCSPLDGRGLGPLELRDGRHLHDPVQSECDRLRDYRDDAPWHPRLRRCWCVRGRLGHIAALRAGTPDRTTRRTQHCQRFRERLLTGGR